MSIGLRGNQRARWGLVLMVAALSGWGATASGADSAAVRRQAKASLSALPETAATEERPTSTSRVDLGRMLFYDPRLSVNHDISCNSCHQLDQFGVDNLPTSPGHKGQLGGRNSPTVYNAAIHISQFWDGREPDVEAQAKGPVLNPVEMAMPSEDSVVVVLKSIPGYAPLFAAAFPDVAEPIDYDNMAIAIGAFERKLLTPSAFDRFIAGDDDALSEDQLEGLALFLGTGCIVCHNGAGIGGGMYQKLGLVKPYPGTDTGRFDVTSKDSDRQFFKVPSLRNIAKTAPYLHDGSIETLDEMIKLMGEYQLGIELGADERSSIADFLGSLTGDVDAEYIAEPDLPPSGPTTPKPDPS